jgi:hypothetical protein
LATKTLRKASSSRRWALSGRGHHDHRDTGVSLPGAGRDLDAVYRAGHMNVGEQQIEAVRAVDHGGGLAAVFGFDDLEPLVAQHFCYQEADQELVLDEQHSDRGHKVLHLRTACPSVLPGFKPHDPWVVGYV